MAGGTYQPTAMIGTQGARSGGNSMPAVFVGGLTLVRPLGMASIPVILISRRAGDYTAKSRYVKRNIVLADHVRRNGDVARGLAEIGKELSGSYGGKLPLFYGTDDELKLIYENDEILSRYYAYLVNERALGEILLNKELFHDACRNLGVLAPKTFPLTWETLRNLESGREAAEFPLVIKPKSKLSWYEAGAGHPHFENAAKAIILQDFDELRQLMENRILDHYRNNLVLQEFIRGDDRDIWSYHGFAAADGRILACFTGRKIRTYPRWKGESSFIRLVHDGEISRFGREIVEKFRLKGVFKLDFKRNPSDGKCYLLEINARYNLWHYLAAKNGLNIPHVAYRYILHGEKVAGETYATTYRWLNFRLDLSSFRELHRLRELTFGQWIRSILSGRNIYSVFAWEDPLPVFFKILWKIRKKLGAWSRSTASSA